jgi:pilus assembly protein Flp/PilA
MIRPVKQHTCFAVPTLLIFIPSVDLIEFSFTNRRITTVRKLNELQKGQGLVEYALILVLIAIVVIVILGILGGQVNTIFSTIASAL